MWFQIMGSGSILVWKVFLKYQTTVYIPFSESMHNKSFEYSVITTGTCVFPLSIPSIFWIHLYNYLCITHNCCFCLLIWIWVTIFLGWCWYYLVGRSVIMVYSILSTYEYSYCWKIYHSYILIWVCFLVISHVVGCCGGYFNKHYSFGYVKWWCEMAYLVKVWPVIK